MRFANALSRFRRMRSCCSGVKITWEEKGKKWISLDHFYAVTTQLNLWRKEKLELKLIDVSMYLTLILKVEVVYGNVKVVIRVER